MIKLQNKRPAIAMIELIFALVIMGIVMMSSPMLISTASKSGFVAIQQEAINEASSHINIIMGYHWDENSSDERFLDPILHVTNGSGDLNVSGVTGRRAGTPTESYRSFIRSDGIDDLNASTVLGSDISDIQEDDMDDFSGLTNLIQITASVADNVETTTIDINTALTYVTDTVGGYNQAAITYNPFINSVGTTNIKSITARLTSSSAEQELQKTIILQAFSCNIGGYKLEERNF